MINTTDFLPREDNLCRGRVLNTGNIPKRSSGNVYDFFEEDNVLLDQTMIDVTFAEEQHLLAQKTENKLRGKLLSLVGGNQGKLKNAMAHTKKSYDRYLDCMDRADMIIENLKFMSA